MQKKKMSIPVRTLRAEVKRYLKTEAGRVFVQEASPNIGKSEDSGWRMITGNKIDRDLPAVTQDKMQNIAIWLYDSDPIAKRILDLKRDFLVGDGVTVHAEDSDVNEVLQDFWNDPINSMDLFIPDIGRDLGLLGEQALPAFVNDQNGHVRLGYIDPCLIDKVVANVDNCRELIGITLRETPNSVENLGRAESALASKWRKEQGLGEPTLGDKKKFTIISANRNVNDPSYGKLTGDVFFFTINKVSGALRGRSDLLSLADWIHNYETFLFNRMERARILNTFLWDVELQDMTQVQIDDWLKKQGVPRPSSIRAHNQKVKWDTVSPNLESNDASNEANMFRAHIAGGAGIPVHWLGGGEGLTRATALEMSTPVFKHLKFRQLYLKYCVTQILNFVIDQAIIHKRLKLDVARKFKVVFPTLSQKDMVSLSTTLMSVSSALVIAKDAKLITPEEASEHMRFALNLLGGDLAPEPGAGTEGEIPNQPSVAGQEPDEGVGLPGTSAPAGLAEAIASHKRVKKNRRK